EGDGILIAVALALAFAPTTTHAAGTSLTVAAPEVDRDKGEIAALIGATRPDGTAARLADVRLLLDDSEAGTPVADDAIADSPSYRPKGPPPVAIGVVYLWAKGGPEPVLDGLEALFKHVPGRVGVYPTPYGQGYRPVITRVTAARAAGGDLADIPPLVGD